MAKNLPLGFAEVFIGGILIVMGFTGDSLAEVVKGDITVNPIDTSSSASGASGSASTGASGADAGGGGSLVQGTGSTAVTSTGKVSASGLSSFAEYEGAPTSGAAGAAWASAILTGLKAPLTSANITALETWFRMEGGGGANNPMNTTLDAAGAISNVPNTPGVKNFATPLDGVKATVQTLLGFPAIVAALRAGNGIPSTPAIAAELSAWSGGGYSSIG